MLHTKKLCVLTAIKQSKIHSKINTYPIKEGKNADIPFHSSVPTYVHHNEKREQ